MNQSTPFNSASRAMFLALLVMTALGVSSTGARASESGVGSPRDSRCETRDTCTNLGVPTVDGAASVATNKGSFITAR